MAISRNVINACQIFLLYVTTLHQTYSDLAHVFCCKAEWMIHSTLCRRIIGQYVVNPFFTNLTHPHRVAMGKCTGCIISVLCCFVSIYKNCYLEHSHYFRLDILLSLSLSLSLSHTHTSLWTMYKSY